MERHLRPVLQPGNHRAQPLLFLRHRHPQGMVRLRQASPRPGIVETLVAHQGPGSFRQQVPIRPFEKKDFRGES